MPLVAKLRLHATGEFATSHAAFMAFNLALRWCVAVYQVEWKGNLLGTFAAGSADCEATERSEGNSTRCRRVWAPFLPPTKAASRRRATEVFSGWGEVAREEAPQHGQAKRPRSNQDGGHRSDGGFSDRESDREACQRASGTPPKSAGSKSEPSESEDVDSQCEEDSGEEPPPPEDVGPSDSDAESAAGLADEILNLVAPEDPSDEDVVAGQAHGDRGVLVAPDNPPGGALPALPPPPLPAPAQAAIPDDVDISCFLPGGSVTWYITKPNDFVVVCSDPRHRSCRKHRTRMGSRIAQKGRPLGYIAAWLAAPSDPSLRDQLSTAKAHMAWTPTLDQRKLARNALKERQCVAADALLRKERPKREDEDSEPELCP